MKPRGEAGRTIHADMGSCLVFPSKGIALVQFCLPGKTDAIGEIEASQPTPVCLLRDHPLTHQQAVALCAPRTEGTADPGWL